MQTLFGIYKDKFILNSVYFSVQDYQYIWCVCCMYCFELDWFKIPSCMWANRNMSGKHRINGHDWTYLVSIWWNKQYLVVASFSPFLQSQTTIQWLSSRPTDASFLPSPEIMSKVCCIKIKFPGYQWHSIHVLTTETKKFFFHSTRKYISITWFIWLHQDFSTKHLLSDVSINQFTTKLMVYLYTTTCM